MEDNKETLISVVEISEFEGEIPRAELSKIEWAPLEGALLVSGIRAKGFVLPGEARDLLSFHGVPKWKIDHCMYVYRQWIKNAGSNGPIHPSEFLSWHERNPVPNLDFQGIEIKSSSAADSSKSRAGSDRSTYDERNQASSDIGNKGSKRGSRSSELKELIDAAIAETKSEDATTIFQIMREWALNEKKSFNALDGDKLIYTSANGKSKTMTSRNIREALRRRQEQAKSGS